MIDRIIEHVLRIIIYLSNISVVLLNLIILLNLALILYILYYRVIRKETCIGLSINLFYELARNSRDFFLPEEKKLQAIKNVEHIKIFLRILVFLLFVDTCSFSPLNYFYKHDFRYLYILSYLYIFWSYLCVLKVKNDRVYAFPLFLNPIKRFRFHKRYVAFMHSAYEILRFESYCDMFLDELSARLKNDCDWLSSKEIAEYDTFIQEQLYQILYQNFSEGKIPESEADRLAKIFQ